MDRERRRKWARKGFGDEGVGGAAEKRRVGGNSEMDEGSEGAVGKARHC